MTELDLTQFGVVGIIALAFLALAYTMKPLIQALASAMHEATEAGKAVLVRWNESDVTLDKNTNALDAVAVYMRELGDSVRHLNEAQKQQNEINRAALQDSVSTIRGDLIVVKDSAVTTLTESMNMSFAAQEDATHHDILQVQGDIKRLSKDFAEGAANAVTGVTEVMSDAKEIILSKIGELATIVTDEHTTEQAEIRDAFSRIEGKIDEAITELREMIALLKQGSPAPVPPVLSVPTLPPQTPAMFVYEDWQQSALYYESDTAPDIRWVRANSVDGVQGLQNEARVSSEIVGYQGARVLKLSANPGDKYPLSIGARVVLTNQKRWDALQPYAGKQLYIRYWVLWPELPTLDEQGGTAGRWCTAGFQIKDNPNTSALYQMNVDAKHKPFLTYREGAAYSQMLDFAYKPNVWTQIDVAWLMRSDSEGQLSVQINGENAYISEGRSAASSGFASFHFLLYTDALRAPADLLIGPVVMSTEPIP